MSGQTELDCAQATAFSTVVISERVLDLLELLLEDARAAVGPERPLRAEPGLRRRAVGDERELAG